MAVFDYLEKVRAKPEPVRHRLAIVWTLVGMALIVGVWLGVLALARYAREGAGAPSGVSRRAEQIVGRVQVGWQRVLESLKFE